jgi:hypothetical protein
VRLGSVGYTATVKEKGNRFHARVQGADDREREGIVSVNPRGFGFVSSVASEEDLYVSEERGDAR